MATLNLSKIKYMSETNLKKFANLIISLSSQVTDVENKCIKPYVDGELYQKDSYVSYNGYIYQATATNQDGAFNEAHWDKLSDDFNELTVADIEAMLGLSSEQLETMANLIADTEVRLDKTYSSSKIYQDIQQCLNDSKAFTLLELGKFSGASYKVVASTSEMTSESIIYLLASGNTYDMYIVEEDGTTTKIGNMDVNLDDYFTKAEIEADYLKKADADGKYATITTVDGKVDKDKIATVLDDTVTDEQIPSAKTVYNTTVYKNIKTYCLFSQLGLSSGCSVGDIFNAMPIGSIGRFDYNGSTITDMPSINGGVLLIDKCNAYRFSIEFKESAYSSVANNNMWIGQLQGSDGSGITWTKLCTSKVEDVSKTTIIFSDETNYKPHYTNGQNMCYEVKNGVCYVSYDIDTVSPTTTGTFITINKLPISSLGYIHSYTFAYNNELTKKPLMIRLGLDGSLAICSGETGSRYLGSFTYPVAE